MPMAKRTSLPNYPKLHISQNTNQIEDFPIIIKTNIKLVQLIRLMIGKISKESIKEKDKIKSSLLIIGIVIKAINKGNR